MRDALVVEAEEMIKTVLERIAGRTDAAQSPLAKRAGRIAGGFQRRGDGRLGRRNRNLTRDRNTKLPIFVVVADEGVAGMFAGHQHAPRRRTDGAAGVMLRELHAFRRQLVERRRMDDFLPIRPDVAVAQIVGENENNVGFARGFRRVETGGEKSGSQHENDSFHVCRWVELFENDVFEPV